MTISFEEAHQKAKEAAERGRFVTWQAVRRIAALSDNQRKELFGFTDIKDILLEYNEEKATEIADDFWEKLKTISLGDVITDGSKIAVCTNVNSDDYDDYIHYICSDGTVGSSWNGVKGHWRKVEQQHPEFWKAWISRLKSLKE